MTLANMVKCDSLEARGFGYTLQLCDTQATEKGLPPLSANHSSTIGEDYHDQLDRDGAGFELWERTVQTQGALVATAGDRLVVRRTLNILGREETPTPSGQTEGGILRLSSRKQKDITRSTIAARLRRMVTDASSRPQAELTRLPAAREFDRVLREKFNVSLWVRKRANRAFSRNDLLGLSRVLRCGSARGKEIQAAFDDGDIVVAHTSPWPMEQTDGPPSQSSTSQNSD
jgi:hypothetical protein